MVEKRPFRAIDVHPARTGHGIMLKLNSNTQWVMVSVAIEFGEHVMAYNGEQLFGVRAQRPFTAPADGTRRSTVGTLNMGTWAGTGEALAWDIASDVPSTSPSHGSKSGEGTWGVIQRAYVRF